MISIGPERRKNILLRFARFCSTFLVVILITSMLTYFSLPLVGRWLVREDAIHKADAIAVLTGSLPSRALEAAQLYRDGYAKEIWLTHPGNKASLLQDLGIHFPSEDEFNYQVLRRQGVPAKAIHVFEMPIANTADELDVIGAALKYKGDESVIIVTSKSHTRRVHSLWNKYHSDEGTMMVHAVVSDEFAPSRWWRNTGDMTQVFHEVLGMMNVWTGMPVQSSVRAHESVASIDSPLTPVVLERTSFKSAD